MLFRSLLLVPALVTFLQAAAPAPQLVVSAGHAGVADAAVFVGPYLATSSWSNVALIDVASGLTVARLPQRSIVTALDAGRSGRLLAVAACDHAIHIWDVTTRTIVRSIALPQECPDSISFSPDETLIVAEGYGCADTRIQVWDVRTGALVRELARGAKMRAVVFGGNGRWIGAAGAEVALYEWPSGRTLATLETGSADSPRPVVHSSPDGRYFAWQSDALHVWDVTRGAEALPPDTAVDRWNRVSRFLDDRRLAYAKDGALKIVSLTDGRQASRALPVPKVEWLGELGLADRLDWLAISRDGTLAAGARDSDIVVSDARRSGLRVLRSPSLVDAWNLQWSRGDLIAWEGLGSGLRGWNARTGVPAPEWPRDAQQKFSFSPDGTRMATSGDSRVRVLQIAGRRTIASRQIDDSPETVVALAPRGAAAVFVSSNELTLFDDALRQVRPLDRLEERSAVERAAFSPDGRWIAAKFGGAHNYVRAYSTDGAGQQVTLDSQDVSYQQPVTFSGDSRWLASFVKGTTLTVWSTGSWSVARSWALGESGQALAFAPEGTRLAVIGRAEAAIWDAETGRKGVTLAGPGGSLREIAWSPDGQRVATAGDDGVMRFWSAADGRLLASLYVLDAGADWLLVAPDGRIDGTAGALRDLVAWRTGDRVVSDSALTQRHRTRGLWQLLR